MIPTLYEDALAYPELFRWFGVAEPELENWLGALPLLVHPGLVDFWRRTGGGVLFEAERLFGPLVAEENDNALKVSELHWSKGLPREMFVFHSGICLSASCVDRRRHRNRIFTFKPDSYEVAQRFYTFNGWYQAILRSEHALRYGL